MAEACRFGKHKIERITTSQDENLCVFNVLCVFISLVTILADLTTDILVLAEYCKDGYVYWAMATIIFILSPNILINIFSLRWVSIDQKSNMRYWITHGCLIGLLERYIVFLYEVFSCKNFESMKTQKWINQRNDLSLLHFLYIFTGTIPQIILQVYSIITLNENFHTKAFALTASVASVVWGCTTYIYSVTVFSNDNFQWKSLILKLIWHFCMLTSRISGIILFTVIFGIWTLIPLGLHWAAMTFWIVIQETTFCPNKLEETLYNVVMGFVYCFCYINLREGHTRYRLMMFYTLMITQNFGSLILYALISDVERQKKTWSITATAFVICGTVIGLSSMILYYKYFHSRGPIPWKYTHNDIELNNKVLNQSKETKDIKAKGLCQVRSFKSQQKPELVETPRKDTSVSDQPQQTDTGSADKKFLLDHWIARSGTPTFISAPVSNNSMNASSIEIYTVENTPHCINIQREDQLHNVKSKLYPKSNKIICSPTELTLKLSNIENLESSIDEITSSNLNLKKRRGICSSDELKDNMTDLNFDDCNLIRETIAKALKTDHSSEISHDTNSSNKKTSSDSIDMDLDLSFSDINSSDINTFNENIVQKLCLSALKNIKVGNQDADIENIQRIALDILKEMYAKKDKAKHGLSNKTLTKQRDLDTPTEILSVHDYENICAVNIAREAWGLRSWNGYSDIENWLHDGSVVRDRRRDTLTSASSEISSCISQDLKSAILTAPPFPKKAHTYSNVFVKFDKSNQDDYVNTVICQGTDDTFLAKPCMIDGKDPNQLEPIIEELDDLGDIDPSCKKRLNSESSLVATIDEIRKVTVSNSPRNLYHRRDHVWDSPQFNGSTKLENNLKRALWKEPSKIDSSNIMESLPEKENVLNVSHGVKLNKDDLNNSGSFTAINTNPENMYKSSKRRQKSNMCNLRTQNKKVINKPPHHLQDLSNKDIDFLWQLVSEKSLSVGSIEDLSSNRISSSLQSLIQKETPTTSVVNSSSSKLSNIKKVVRSRPRRKFSILRERFEPKMISNSDEEILYHCSEKSVLPTDSNSINIINHFDISKDVDDKESNNKHEHLSQARVKNNCSPFTSECVNSKNLREKRSLFMKQVLSPPKFNTKLRYKV